MAKVLVVEDERSITIILTYMLQRIGHDVITASNGNEALELLQSGTADLALVDIMMPIMNGHQLIAALLESHPSLPIIVVTAHPGDADNAMQSSNVRRKIIKPFGVNYLRTTINQVLNT